MSLNSVDEYVSLSEIRMYILTPIHYQNESALNSKSRSVEEEIALTYKSFTRVTKNCGSIHYYLHEFPFFQF